MGLCSCILSWKGGRTTRCKDRLSPVPFLLNLVLLRHFIIVTGSKTKISMNLKNKNTLDFIKSKHLVREAFYSEDSGCCRDSSLFQVMGRLCCEDRAMNEAFVSASPPRLREHHRRGMKNVRPGRRGAML